ncbi:DgyrCDS10078 [Dimorphilus gyrociliatus]|uniref:DgyrCDS10078 n=1 Tax=Dimorphilus gyrociliatus TaxID=2664684 RepID=A0A7I8W1Q2_9ANNE|nr:DgyrCDS10078 [Dimorphilus gyrociliatus]
MSTGLGLSTLREEEDEMEWSSGEEEYVESEYEADEDEYEQPNEEDDDNDGDYEEKMSTWRNKPNQFDNLCDGVVQAITMVHSALTETLLMKDKLLEHHLPPNVLVELSLTSTKLYRSVSDMNTPVYELIRLVRLYSTPWEEKSAALKKLHEDYDRKARQLDVAVKRLQMVDAQALRMARERRILNWEKLFSKISCSKGHGRRWKFLIDSFKKRVKEGPESFQDYVNTLDQDDQEDSEDEENAILEAAAERIITPSEDKQSTGKLDSETFTDKNDSETETERDGESAKVQSDKEKSPVPEKVVYFKPETKDACVYTNEPVYDRKLHIRLYKPQDITQSQLKSVVTYGSQYFKTGILDVPISPEPTEDAAEQQPPPLRRPGRGRLIGSKNTNGVQRPTAAKKDKKNSKRHFEECILLVNEEHGVTWVDGRKEEKSSFKDNIRIALHHGENEDMFALATVEIEELEKLELPSVFLRPDIGDDPDLSNPSTSTFVSYQQEEKKRLEKVHIEEEVENFEPMNYPLYSIHTGLADAMHMPCGQQPLLFFWVKREIPKTVHKLTESETVEEIVYDVTGFDMSKVSKEDLHRDTDSVALSAPRFTPEPVEETVSKNEYEKMKENYEEKFLQLQEEYEGRLEHLVNSLNNLNNEVNKPSKTEDVRTAVRTPSPKIKTTLQGPKPPNIPQSTR